MHSLRNFITAKLTTKPITPPVDSTRDQETFRLIFDHQKKALVLCLVDDEMGTNNANETANEDCAVTIAVEHTTVDFGDVDGPQNGVKVVADDKDDQDEGHAVMNFLQLRMILVWIVMKLVWINFLITHLALYCFLPQLLANYGESDGSAGMDNEIKAILAKKVGVDVEGTYGASYDGYQNLSMMWNGTVG